MRFFYITVILVGIMLTLNIGGFEIPSGSMVRTFYLVSSDGNISVENFKNSPLWSNDSADDSIPGIKYILTAFVAAGIVLGVIGRSPDIRYILAGLVFVLTGLLTADLISIYSTMSGFGVDWITFLGTVLIGSSLAGLYITALQFWQGND
jgi:hypothetical protein